MNKFFILKNIIIMVQTEPSVLASARYTDKDARELLGISQPTLRKYVREGVLHQRYHAGSRRRYYLGSDILDFWYGRI